MKLQKLEGDFAVCKVAAIDQIDFTRDFVFLAKTPDEISLVCEEAHVPPDAIEVEAGWKALKVAGVLDFGLIGIIAKISSILAEAGISIFVVSTYNTDYILLKSENFDSGLRALVDSGYIVVGRHPDAPAQKYNENGTVAKRS